MKIFKIEFEVDDYKSLLAKDDSVHEKNLLDLDGTSKKNEWGEFLDAEIDNVEAQNPDIYSCGVGNMLLPEDVFELLKNLLPANVEYLPVRWLNGKGFIVNIIGFSNCLDSLKSEWLIDDETGKKLFIDKHIFLNEKVPDCLLFKIEDDCFEIFCSDKESYDFKKFVEINDLKGLSFELVWESN